MAASESRTVTAAIELREADGGAPLLTGYASTFNQDYDLGGFVERVAPTAFARTLGTNPDVRLLIDHEGQPLARTKSGTLQLSTDEIGLRVEARLDPTDPDVQRLMPKMRRRDLDQMSFAFRVPAGGDEWNTDYTVRTLRNVELNGGDVSIVTYPANPSTSVSVRSAERRAANVALCDALLREVRLGKAISADNYKRLLDVLANLAVIDEAIDQADTGLDNAQAALSDLLGVANPDPAEPDDMQANSLPLGLAQRIARLSIAG